MGTQPLSVYSLAFMPDDVIAQEVKEMKQLLKTHIGKSYGSANADAHISLDSFEAADENYPHIIAEYQRIIQTIAPFSVQFSGFGDFDGYFRAFYIRVDDTSADHIRQTYGHIRGHFDKQVKKQFMRKWQDETKSPHMTIGRRMEPDWIVKAHTLFTEYERTQLCNAFFIRKYNDKRRQYDVVDRVELGAGLEGLP
jgi:2'-5' RNA ligase